MCIKDANYIHQKKVRERRRISPEFFFTLGGALVAEVAEPR